MYRKIFLPLCALAFCGFIAQLVTFAPTVKAASISVSPPRFEIFGNPGDTINEKIKVTNPSDAQLTYQVDTEDFVAQGDEGGVDFVDKSSPTNSYSLAKWLTVEPSSFTVGPGEDRQLNFTVRIPQGAEPGGHYASVLVTLAGNAITGGASVQSRVGTLILLRVSGDTKEVLSLDSFKSDNSYYKKGPINFSLRTNNTGNVHVAPTGTIVITNMFGRKVKELPLTQANVLPGSSRMVKTLWDQQNMIGRFTATLVATYGQSNQALTATTSFIVLPPTLIYIVLGIIALLALIFTQRKNIRKALNRLTAD